jgi:hypothetical protein
MLAVEEAGLAVMEAVMLAVMEAVMLAVMEAVMLAVMEAVMLAVMEAVMLAVVEVSVEAVNLADTLVDVVTLMCYSSPSRTPSSYSSCGVQAERAWVRVWAPQGLDRCE